MTKWSFYVQQEYLQTVELPTNDVYPGHDLDIKIRKDHLKSSIDCVEKKSSELLTKWTKNEVVLLNGFQPPNMIINLLREKSTLLTKKR